MFSMNCITDNHSACTCCMWSLHHSYQLHVYNIYSSLTQCMLSCLISYYTGRILKKKEIRILLKCCLVIFHTVIATLNFIPYTRMCYKKTGCRLIKVFLYIICLFQVHVMLGLVLVLFNHIYTFLRKRGLIKVSIASLPWC